MSLTQNSPIGSARYLDIKALLRSPAAFIFFLQLGVFLACTPLTMRGYSDFRQLYTAGWMVRTGHAAELYNLDAQSQFQQALVRRPIPPLPFNHLSYEALLLAPLSLLPFRGAYLASAALNLAFLAFAMRLVTPRIAEIAKTWKRLPLPVILGTVPIAISLVQGQDSILLLTLFAAAWSALDAGDEVKAGVLVALTLFKFQFSIPVFILFLVWRRWRFAGGFALAALLIVAVSLWTTGLNGFLTYMHMLTSMSVGLTTAADQSRYQISTWMMPNIRGLLDLCLPVRAAGIGTALGSLGVLVYAALKRPFFPLAVLVAMLVSYHGLIHDACILQIPILAILALQTNPKRTLLANAILVSPAVLFPAGQLYCLMTVPLIWAVPEVAQVTAAGLVPVPAERH
jgi:Glycosyltransferase family 87